VEYLSGVFVTKDTYIQAVTVYLFNFPVTETIGKDAAWSF